MEAGSKSNLSWTRGPQKVWRHPAWPQEVSTALHDLVDKINKDKCQRLRNLVPLPLWWALKTYENYYESHPVKWYVPRINPKYQLTLDEFHTRFRAHGLPVIINFESLRSIGFKMQKWDLDDL